MNGHRDVTEGASRSSLLRGSNQLPGVDAEGVRDPLDVLQGQIPLPALDRADVGAVEVAALPELLLRQAEGLASLADNSTQALR